MEGDQGVCRGLPSSILNTGILNPHLNRTDNGIVLTTKRTNPLWLLEIHKLKQPTLQVVSVRNSLKLKQKSVLSVTECGDSCALLASKAFVAPELTPRLTLYFLGATIDSARVSALIKGKPHESDDHDTATCANVRAFLPFEAVAK